MLCTGGTRATVRADPDIECESDQYNWILIGAGLAGFFPLDWKPVISTGDTIGLKMIQSLLSFELNLTLKEA